MAPRLKSAFPSIHITALYGGSEDRHTYSPLVISTTHQLCRFRDAFDMMIIDEVDAFPYSMDRSLKFAVEKSKKADASVILLTATPSPDMKRDRQRGRLQAVKIPARYHRKPIPLPQLKWSGHWKKQLERGLIPKTLQHWIEFRLEKEIPFLLFFPSITMMEYALPLFQKLDRRLLSVHSEHPERKGRVQSLRNREIPGLLTTTILERGVTIERLDAAVIGAEHEVFTESALVQIAGRVGRSASFPIGNVTFFHYGKSEAMVSAARHIEMMNKEAAKRGLLDV